MLENLFMSLTLLYNPSTQVMSVEEGSHYILSSEQYAVIRRLGTLSKENRIPISCCFLEKRMSRLISLVNNEKNLQYKYIDVLKHTCLFVCERFNDFQSPTTEDWRTKLFLWVKQKLSKVAGLEKVMSYRGQIIELPKSHTSPLDMAYVRWEVHTYFLASF